MGAVTNLDEYRKSTEPVIDPATPWGALGFLTERDMLLDDLKTVQARIKSGKDTGTAIKALLVEKREIMSQLRDLDSGEGDPDSILDEAEDEAWSPDDAR